MDVFISINLVCILFGPAVPTSSFSNFVFIIIIIIIIIALQNAQRGKKIEMGLAVISSDEASAD